MYEIKTTIQKSRHFAYEGIHSVGIKIGCHLRIVAFALVENVNSCHIFVRFGFDDRRTSQTLRIVKNKATGTLHWVYCIPFLVRKFVLCEVMARNGLYICISVGLSVARFDNPGNAKAFLSWNE